MSADGNQIGAEDNGNLYKTLLESTKAIPWRIDWASQKFAYIGPQIEELLGFTQDSWQTVQDWAARIHEDDRERVVNFCVSQSMEGIDHEADYRALTAEGEFVWIRDVVHVIRRGDEVEALVGFMFDITERKNFEDELFRLHKRLEELSYTDGLTGVANRRLFDQTLEREWASARREARSLSLIMIDIDYFKDFNDQYGHIEGDDCLKRVAKLLAAAAARPRDLLARVGGEEFIMILPEADTYAAKAVAEKCRRLVLNEKIAHRASQVGAYVSISLGVSTVVPSEKDNPKAFMERVDWLLYQAKKRGRNQAVSESDVRQVQA